MSVSSIRQRKKPVLLQINVVANSGSTGRIAEGIGQMAIKAGWESYIAYGRWANPSQSELIKVGTKRDVYSHVLQTRLFDRHGLASKVATKKLIRQVGQIKPDVIHLHNVHGYYLNYPLLFSYLAETGIPVVWTLHDCWAFTGHCAYFSYVGCEKWKEQCGRCPNKKDYPASWGLDNSTDNYRLKKKFFTSMPNLTLVPVSGWLDSLLPDSFLRNYVSRRIYNGIDTVAFRPVETSDAVLERYGIPTTYFVLGVTNVWDQRKGLRDFIRLREILPDSYSIVLVGLSKQQISGLPQGMIGIRHTERMESLRELYSGALAFVNLTWEDNFPTTNLEALACGTPVITYRTGGSPEAVTLETGFVVSQGDLKEVVQAIGQIARKGKAVYTDVCRKRAIRYFDKEKRFEEYIGLYQSLLSQNRN